MSKDYIKSLEKNVAYLEKENSKLINKLKLQHIENDKYLVKFFKQVFKDGNCKYEINNVNDVIECNFRADKFTCTPKFLKFLYKLGLVQNNNKEFNGIIEVRIGERVITVVDCFDGKSIIETK